MYKLGNRSKSNLRGINSDLIRIVERAIELTTQDFTVIEGLRTKERQRELVDKGASMTMNSKHIIGRAFDVAAYDSKDGIVFHSGLYYPIAEAMAKAAKEFNTPLIWGACWLNITNSYDLNVMVFRYIERKRNQGRRPFLDYGHFQLG